MKKLNTYIVAFLLTFSFIFLGATETIYASKTINDMQKEKDKINNEIKALENKLNATIKDRKNEEAERNQYNDTLYQINEDLAKISSNLELTRSNLEATEKELEDAKIAREEQYESFKQRTRYMYMNGSMSYLDVILNADSFSDMVKRVDYVNKIVDYDLTLADKMEETETLITTKVGEIAKQKSDLEALELVEKDKKYSYEQMVLAKNESIQGLYAEESDFNKMISDNEKADKEIEELIVKAQAEQKKKDEAARLAAAKRNNSSIPYTYDGKKLQWPVPGRSTISSGYGNRYIFGRNEFHTGLDIPAPYGHSIVAAEDGVVIRAAFMSNGFGNQVIIDHGGGLSTLYAHNSSLTVKVGDRVTRGQQVAKAGSTGLSTGNHLHFEVRINGKHQNPNNYTSP